MEFPDLSLTKRNNWGKEWGNARIGQNERLENNFETNFFFHFEIPAKKNNLSYAASDLYYKQFTIVIYNRNAIGQYYKITIVVMANYDCS